MDYAISPIRRFVSTAGAWERALLRRSARGVADALIAYCDLARSAVNAEGASDPAAMMSVELSVRSSVDDMVDRLQDLLALIPAGALCETVSGRAASEAVACARRWKERSAAVSDDPQIRLIPTLMASLITGPARLPLLLAESMSYLLDQLDQGCGVMVPSCVMRARFAQCTSSFEFVDDLDCGEVLLQFSIPDPTNESATALRDVQAAMKAYETADWWGDRWDQAITRVELRAALRAHADTLRDLSSRYGQLDRAEALLTLPQRFTFPDFVRLVPIVRELIDAKIPTDAPRRAASAAPTTTWRTCHADFCPAVPGAGRASASARIDRRPNDSAPHSQGADCALSNRSCSARVNVADTDAWIRTQLDVPAPPTTRSTRPAL